MFKKLMLTIGLGLGVANASCDYLKLTAEMQQATSGATAFMANPDNCGSGIKYLVFRSKRSDAEFYITKNDGDVVKDNKVIVRPSRGIHSDGKVWAFRFDVRYPSYIRGGSLYAINTDGKKIPVTVDVVKFNGFKTKEQCMDVTGTIPDYCETVDPEEVKSTPSTTNNLPTTEPSVYDNMSKKTPSNMVYDYADNCLDKTKEQLKKHHYYGAKKQASSCIRRLATYSSPRLDKKVEALKELYDIASKKLEARKKRGFLDQLLNDRKDVMTFDGVEILHKKSSEFCDDMECTDLYLIRVPETYREKGFLKFKNIKFVLDTPFLTTGSMYVGNDEETYSSDTFEVTVPYNTYVKTNEGKFDLVININNPAEFKKVIVIRDGERKTLPIKIKEIN